MMGPAEPVVIYERIFWNFTSRSRFRVILISLSPLDLDFRGHFYFTFISRKEWTGKKIHPFSWEKEWNLTPSFIKRYTIRGSAEPKTKYVRNNFRFSKILEKFYFSISISKLFHFTFTSHLDFPSFLFHFHFSNLISTYYFFTCTSWKEWMAFFLHFSLLDCPKPTLAGHSIIYD